MESIIIKTINCELVDISKVNFSEYKIKDNYYKIPYSVLSNLGYSKIEAKALEGYEFHSTKTKKDIYNGWIVFNDNTKIHLNTYELYEYDRWGDKAGTKYNFSVSYSFSSASIGRVYNGPTLDSFNIKYIIPHLPPKCNAVGTAGGFCQFLQKSAQKSMKSLLSQSGCLH